MANKPQQSKLDALKSILGRLTNQPAARPAEADLKAVDQYITELGHDLKASQDQMRLATLYRVSQALGTSLNLDQVLTQVMDSVIGLTKAERGFLVLVEPDSGAWKLRAARNYQQEDLQPRDLDVSRTVINTVLESGAGLVTTDAQTDPRFSEHESVVFYALRSIMCAPLLSRGQVIGAVYVDNRAQAGLLRQEDLELLNAFATQAAIAIDNARLYTRTDQALALHVSELETLGRLDSELNAELDLKHTMEITYNWFTSQSAAAQTWVILAEDGNLEGEVTTYPEGFAGFKDDLVQQALAQASLQVVAPAESTLARLAIPIVHSSRLLGVVLAERANAFSETEMRFLTHLVSRSAAAIQNALLYDSVNQMSEAKSKFISVVTHELRIPMTSIKGYADLMRQGAVGPVNDMQANFLDVIRNNVERMSNLVSDLSDISKIESGQVKLTGNLVPLKVYVDEGLRNLRTKITEKGQSLDVEVSGDLPQVYVDTGRLLQVLSILVTNAMKYTPADGKILVKAQRQGAFVRAEVIDSGIGISAQDQPKVFSQFFRSEDPAVRSEQGWGLGLAVAKRLVELMGGAIGFTSTHGQGSTFWFTLPTSASAEKGAAK